MRVEQQLHAHCQPSTLAARDATSSCSLTNAAIAASANVKHVNDVFHTPVLVPLGELAWHAEQRTVTEDLAHLQQQLNREWMSTPTRNKKNKHPQQLKLCTVRLSKYTVSWVT